MKNAGEDPDRRHHNPLRLSVSVVAIWSSFQGEREKKETRFLENKPTSHFWLFPEGNKKFFILRGSAVSFASQRFFSALKSLLIPWQSFENCLKEFGFQDFLGKCHSGDFLQWLKILHGSYYDISEITVISSWLQKCKSLLFYPIYYIAINTDHLDINFFIGLLLSSKPQNI